MRESQRDATQSAAQQAPSDPLASAVARSVSELRHSAGLSERAAARKLGTSQTQLRRMEDPRYLPSLRSLARLAAVYGYDLTVDFTPKGSAVRAKAAAAKPKTKAKAKAKRRPSGSGSPSKARGAAPHRGRAAARSKARRAAPRRRS